MARLKQKPLTNQFRIIGGEWRGRKLSFASNPQIRPTPDRVRETLFNWLQMEIEGAQCLDLFAGSGALGLEALSRGAQRAVFVEQDAQTCSLLNDNMAVLSVTSQRAPVMRTNALDFLQKNNDKYDVVFLDPPYKLACLYDCLTLLAQRQLINPRGAIYVEDACALDSARIPGEYRIHREQTAGQVHFGLLKVNS